MELFKEHLEGYVEKHSKGYIKDIGKHRWDSRFYSEFMTIVSISFHYKNLLSINAFIWILY